jgi:predicted ester cyclase
MRTLIAITLAGFITACSSPQPTTPKEPDAAAQRMTADESVRWYQACWNDFSEHKWDEFKKCYAGSAISQQLGYGQPTATGADAIVGSSEEFVKMFPDGRGDLQLILANGGHVAGIAILKGTQAGTKKKFGLMFGHAVDVDPVERNVTKEIGVMARAVAETGGPAPKIVIARNDDTESSNVAADLMLTEAWNKHDLAGVQMYEADDMVFHDMTAPKDLNKKEADANAQVFWKAFSDAKLSTSAMWGAGDYVVVIGQFDGTNDGDFPAMQLRKTGTRVSIPFFEIDRFEDGKTKEVWLFFDRTLFASQLGVKAG